MIEVVEAAFADWDAEPLLARLAEVGVPAGKVRTLDEVYAWDQTASQGLLVDVEHSTLGRVTLPGPPLRFFDADGAEVTRRDHGAPPVLDQHADDDPRLARGGGVTRRWTAHELLDLVLDDGTFESWDRPIDISHHAEDYRRVLSRGGREGRHRRVGADRARTGARSAGRGGGQRVPVPGRVHRPVRRGPDHPRRTTGDRRGPARSWPARPRAAPGCRRAPRPSCRWSRSPGR